MKNIFLYNQATELTANSSDKKLVLKSNLVYTKNGRFLDKLYDQDGQSDTYNYNSKTGYLDSVNDLFLLLNIMRFYNI